MPQSGFFAADAIATIAIAAYHKSPDEGSLPFGRTYRHRGEI